MKICEMLLKWGLGAGITYIRKESSQINNASEHFKKLGIIKEIELSKLKKKETRKMRVEVKTRKYKNNGISQ